MSKQRAVFMATVLFLVAATPAMAQRQGGRGRGPGGGPGGMLMNPVQFLMQQEELGLDEEQTAAMQLLAEELDEANAPDRERVQEAMGAGRGGGGRGAMRELRPVMEAIRDRNEATLERVKELLTDEQKLVAERLIEENQAAGRGRRGGGA